MIHFVQQPDNHQILSTLPFNHNTTQLSIDLLSSFIAVSEEGGEGDLCVCMSAHACVHEKERQIERARKRRVCFVFCLQLHVSCFIGLHSARSASLILSIYPIKHENNLSEAEARVVLYLGKLFSLSLSLSLSFWQARIYILSSTANEKEQTSILHPFGLSQPETAARFKTIAQSCHSPPPRPPSLPPSLLLPSSPSTFLLPLKSQARITSKSKHTLTTSESHSRHTNTQLVRLVWSHSSQG